MPTVEPDMKSRSFPKLDRQKKNGPGIHRGHSPVGHVPQPNGHISAPDARSIQVDQKTWIEWRMKLGATRKEATKLWHDYQEWRAVEAQNPRVRVFTVKAWQNWEREFRAFLDEMPRKPFDFLARVAAAEKRRTALAMVADRKMKSRSRYERQYARRAYK